MCTNLGYLIGVPRLLERGGEDYEVIFEAVADWIVCNMRHAISRCRILRPNRYICAQSRRQTLRRIHRTQECIKDAINKDNPDEDEDAIIKDPIDKDPSNKNTFIPEPLAARKVQIESDWEFKIYLSLDFATACSPENIRLILTHLIQIKLGLQSDETVWQSPETGHIYDLKEFRIIVKYFDIKVYINLDSKCDITKKYGCAL